MQGWQDILLGLAPILSSVVSIISWMASNRLSNRKFKDYHEDNEYNRLQHLYDEQGNTLKTVRKSRDEAENRYAKWRNDYYALDDKYNKLYNKYEKLLNDQSQHKEK